jgi:hypothetical protein
LGCADAAGTLGLGCADAVVASGDDVGELGFGCVDADAAGALVAPAEPGYFTVLEGAVGVEFELFDGTGFGDNELDFRGSAGDGFTIVKDGLPELAFFWDLLLSRTR